MLVLSRKRGEEILIGERIRIKIISIEGGKVSIGIQAPSDVPVNRLEVALRINQETRIAS